MSDSSESKSTPLSGKDRATPEGLAFARRLKQASDAQDVPPKNFGRYPYFAERLGVSTETVRRYFAGEAIPRREKMEKIAVMLGIEVTWLSMGVTSGVSSDDRKKSRQFANGAVGLVANLIQLEGGSVSVKNNQQDPSSFHAIIGGHLLNYVVVAAEASADEDWIVRVPMLEPEQLLIVVFYHGRMVFDLVQVPQSLVKLHGKGKTGSSILTVSGRKGRYKIGDAAMRSMDRFQPEG